MLEILARKACTATLYTRLARNQEDGDHHSIPLTRCAVLNPHASYSTANGRKVLSHDCKRPNEACIICQTSATQAARLRQRVNEPYAFQA
ncbi:MAG: hypothetical protein CBE00_00625 [Planctomycetaceae bacterium TMED240]|nr:hypothetical protein [Rhodopirellula sp.]OUX08911.1 MAG: hypothetical protein CBE00_00625 [Planctomycetaceae bacterium TMED240]